MSLGIVLVQGPSLPRVTYLTRDWVENLTRYAFDYLAQQSGGRMVVPQFRVFDWWRMPVSDAVWAGLGWQLGPKLRPLFKSTTGNDLAGFSHLAMVIDQFDAGLAAWDPPVKNLHIGAKDFTPSLYQHELGHLMGAAHAGLELPRMPDPYGDPFCIMGAEGGKFSFSEPSLDFVAHVGEQGWRLCTQCGGLFDNRDPANKGVCPGAVGVPGSGHAAGADAQAYLLPNGGTPFLPGGAGWRACVKCRLLFRPDATVSACAAGGQHQTALTPTEYVLPADVPPGPGEAGWFSCRLCGAVFLSAAAGGGRCAGNAAGTGHDRVAGGPDHALPRNVVPANPSGPAMNAATLFTCGWLDTARFGHDVGQQLRARPGRADVTLPGLEGAPPASTPATPVVAFADGLAQERLFVEYRRALNADPAWRWDLGVPESVTGARSGWVLVHLARFAGAKDSLLLASIPAHVGAIATIDKALLRVRVGAVAADGSSVTLTIQSAKAPTLPPISRKATLPERSNVTPALASDDQQVFLAWVGTDGRINLALSVDGGLSYVGKLTTGEFSPHAPAIACNNGRVWLAWTGTDTKLNLAIVTWDKPPLAPRITGLVRKTTLEELSPHGPALAHGGTDLFLAWTGTGDNHLNLLVGVGSVTSARFKQVFDQERSTQAPALAAHRDGRLHLGFRSASGARTFAVLRVRVPESPDQMGVVKKVVLPETSEHAPALAADRERLHVAWTGESNKRLNLVAPVATSAATGKRVYDGESSDAGPALVRHRSAFLLGWRGRGNNQLNVAELADRGIPVDDFRSGPGSFQLAPPGAATQVHLGTMLGGRRVVRVEYPPGAAGADGVLKVERGELLLSLAAGLGAQLSIGYGFDPTAPPGPGLGVDLRNGGADRLRLDIAENRAIEVEVTALVLTGATLHTASAFVTAGAAEILYSDFGGSPDLSGVDRLQIVFRIGGFQGVAPFVWPALRITRLEATS